MVNVLLFFIFHYEITIFFNISGVLEEKSELLHTHSTSNFI